MKTQVAEMQAYINQLEEEKREQASAADQGIKKSPQVSGLGGRAPRLE